MRIGKTIIAGAVALGVLGLGLAPASAEHGRNRAAAVGAVGGFAAGAALGAAVNAQRGGYYPGPARYYYDEEPAYECHIERQQMSGDDGRLHLRRVRVCD